MGQALNPSPAEDVLMRPLEGLVALVTGCGRYDGLGRSIALSLAWEGAHVAVTDIVATGTTNRAEVGVTDTAAEWNGIESLVEEVRALGVRSVALTGDVGNPDDAQRLVDEAISQLGSVDILVNNAGAPHGP